MADVELQSDARTSLQDAVQFSFEKQQSDGHWVAEVSADVTFTSQYVMFKYAMGFDLSDADALRCWLLQDQEDDGSWSLAPNHPGNVSTTTEAYLALKILGLSPDDPAMQSARRFLIGNGGVAKVRFFTRFFLATFGLVPWSAIPQIPAELILMPASSPLNIYTLSSWARSTMIPVLIIRHHEPVYALPNGLSPDNDFLDEIWCDPSDKNIPFTPSLSSLLLELDVIQFGFTAADKILALLGGLKRSPLRKRSRRKCVEWLLEHQESAGDWAGFFPPMHGSVWALILEGYHRDHKRIQLGMEAIERLSITDARGKRIAPTVSPVWDTALMLSALCDAGNREDIRVRQASDWVKARQLLGPQGDWRVYSPNKQAGGWSFEYENTWYPDVDDTAVIVIALIKQDPYFIGSECISNAIKWILGMQGPDGGYGAFDYDNNKLWLHKIPFSDMDSLCDPSSADITGRVLECFGFLLSHRYGSWDQGLKLRVEASSERAMSYLFSEQEASGAFWGRWGNNYNYGTGNVLRGMVHFAHKNADVRKSVARAIQWFLSVQNTDGGWGEDLLSYSFPEMAGQGESTAAQTAWALLSLQPYRSNPDSAIEKGIRWLVTNQKVISEHGRSWPTDLYTATGFPKVLYLGYPYYHHLFPMMALKKYIAANNEADFEAIELPIHVVEPLNRPSILLMVIGSRGDIQVFLNIAKLLTASFGYRVRIATHPLHQSLVETAGMDFYSVGGSPEAFAKTFTENPNILLSAINGELGEMRRLFNTMIEKYWRSSIDNNPDINSAEKPQKLTQRPFLADTIVASLPTIAHIHCAEKLQIPLLLVSLQPVLPTGDFPHVFTLTKPRFSSGHLWNKLSYIIIELLNWLAFASYLNYLRVSAYGMRAVSWTWAAYDFWDMRIPHVCLWSPSVLPRPSGWDPHTTITGYTFDKGESFLPPKSLKNFLETDKPVLAIGFGSASIPDASRLMSVIFTAVGKIGARGVICSNRTRFKISIPVPDDIYLVEEIPHGWLLPRVQGFIHHGGAGHTAIGLKLGIPMLIIPFFLDQNFWAAKIQELQLGPPALDYRAMTSQMLASSLEDLVSHKYQGRCKEVASQICSQQDGADVTAETIARLQTSEVKKASCDLIQDLKAHWHHLDSGLHLSCAAAACLTSHNVLQWSDLDLEPGLDWSERRTATSTAGVKLVNDLMDLLYRLVLLVYTMLEWIVAPWTKLEMEDSYSAKMRDPVRQARIEQGEYDLGFIIDNTSKSKGGVSIEDRIVKNWQFLSTAWFQAKFVDDSHREHYSKI
ncbi:MAG: hypothetical protein Q9181_001889 [Wetmoreana brouardii]